MPNPVILHDSTSSQDNPQGRPIGTAANPLVTSQSDGSGGTATGLPPGRASAANSVPGVMCNEDKAALDAAKSNYTVNGGVYVNNTARAAGNGILAVITTAGTATLTFGGTDVAFTFVVGPTILPLAITKTVLGTAVGSFYAIS
ncbi:hypothetical protein [Rhizobium rhizogenes]|uniref:hypothetical protein n=1 Tax=Rhizobium rhizogenes TaxID=359 RepID=UPI0022BA7F02|nr:hypothetical protein [Rhizobium rhizogenes]MCZ7480570.1 hypothetical protein [Rhizobium rhizogenes]